MESNDVDGVDKNSDADGNHDYHDMDNSNEDSYHYYAHIRSKDNNYIHDNDINNNDDDNNNDDMEHGQ